MRRISLSLSLISTTRLARAFRRKNIRMLIYLMTMTMMTDDPRSSFFRIALTICITIRL